MARGRRPTAAIAEAKEFAERMGYGWTDNPHEDLAFDFFIYKPESFRAIAVRMTRNRIEPEAFFEKLFPEEIAGLRALPFPEFILRELWLRTRHERAWRRLIVYRPPIAVGEIGWWGPDDYVNPYAR